MILKPNNNIACYKLVSMLAKCSTCEVWSAISVQDKTVVALKIFNKSSELQKKAEMEYRYATQLKNNNILSPIEFNVVDDVAIIVFPYCKGKSVDNIAGYMLQLNLWMLIRDIASALDSIHKLQYVHGCINPSNILWNGETFVLSDFGHVKSNGDSVYDGIKENADFRFVAPEAGNGHICTASDVWSLGATAFYLIMGCPVFNGFGGLAQTIKSPVPYMRKTMPEISELIKRCLSYNIIDRPSADFLVKTATQNIEQYSKKISDRKIKQIAVKSNFYEGDTFWHDAMI